MSHFIRKFDVRWSDLDANRHVANSAYMNFMSHTRMEYLMTHGFSHEDMLKMKIGPVIFHEHLHFFREVLPGQTIYVSLELKGLSKDGMFFEFEHNIYGEDGQHHLYAELMGGFIDLETRKLTALSERIAERTFEGLSRTSDFKWLTSADTRKHHHRPTNRPDLVSQASNFAMTSS